MNTAAFLKSGRYARGIVRLCAGQRDPDIDNRRRVPPDPVYHRAGHAAGCAGTHHQNRHQHRPGKEKARLDRSGRPNGHHGRSVQSNSAHRKWAADPKRTPRLPRDRHFQRRRNPVKSAKKTEPLYMVPSFVLLLWTYSPTSVESSTRSLSNSSPEVTLNLSSRSLVVSFFFSSPLTS